MNTNTTISQDDQAALNRAASLLEATGRHSRRNSVAIRCLTAAELLARAGAEPDPALVVGPAERLWLTESLQLLGGVSDDLIGDARVLDAVHFALLAHAATS